MMIQATVARGCHTVSRFGWTLLFALSVEPSLARADESDTEAAHRLFYEGRELASEARYDEACLKFEQAQKLAPGIGILFNLADCFEQTGRPASAWASFVEVARLAAAAEQREREAVARERAAALEPKLPRLIVEVRGPDTLVVKRDGVLMDRQVWGTSLPVDPGPHVVEVAEPGAEPRQWKVTVAPGPGATRLVVMLPERQRSKAATVPATNVSLSTPTAGAGALPGEPSSDRAATTQRTAGFVLAGAGFAALATGVVFGVVSQRKNEQALELCPEYDPQREFYACGSQTEVVLHDDLVEDARRARSVSLIGVASSVASLAGAAVLFWTASLPRERPSVTLVPEVERRAARLTVRAAF